ncbi:MAG: cysteine synthase family protein [Candidatus Omnitrophica bacterium]|nr:cysteine synthase family protein [Candidatus Omnitrophota bacterium]
MSGKPTSLNRSPLPLRPDEGAPGVLGRIGNTPLYEFRQVTPKNDRVKIFAKLEWYNPAGSVKDRPAYRMIAHGEQTGALKPGKIILDASSGNTGIAYAMIGACRGYQVRLCIPKNVCIERKQMLAAYGAEVIYTDPRKSSDGAIVEAQRLMRENPDLYFYPDQYNNDQNWTAHFETTGPEIIRQTGGQVTHFIAGLGTTGSLMGTGRRLKKELKHIKVIAMQPDSPFHGLEGLKHMESAIVPGIYDANFPDDQVSVRTEDAHEMVRRLAREEGMLVGISSGAVMKAALNHSERIETGNIVVIFPDGGDRYLSESFWKA